MKFRGNREIRDLKFEIPDRQFPANAHKSSQRREFKCKAGLIGKIAVANLIFRLLRHESVLSVGTGNDYD